MYQPNENQSQLLLGENLPTWFAFLLALFGIITCMIAAQLIVPKSLQSNIVLPWVTKLMELPKKDNSKTKPNYNIDNLKLENKKNQLATNPSVIEPTMIEIEPTVTKPTIIEPISDCPPLFSFKFPENSLIPLTLDQNQKIGQLKDWLDLHPHHTVILEGYSNSTGTKDANLMLSYKRAKSVQNTLVKKGILIEQLSVSAFGEDHLLVGIPSTSEKNRRVSMRIEGILECQYYSDN